MESIWEILGLEPARDVSAIKRAYAQKARICHPEEDPSGFMKLREAYQAALDWAEGRDVPPEEALAEEKPAGEEESWQLQEEGPESLPNPYEDSEAIRRFVDLYTGKQRKNPKLWMDYFTSDAFLDVGWDSQFTALLLEKITEVEDVCPPNREFMLWLSIAYQFS